MKIKIYTAYIALGGNLSNPKQNFQAALTQFADRDVSIKSVSSLWHSPAWPTGLGHPDYTNAVVSVDTSLSAVDLLNFLHEIEASFGRVRTYPNAPRNVDLDLLDFAGQTSNSYPLLPHPRMMQRPFVLLPLLEVNSRWMHPDTGLTPLKALSSLPSQDVLSHHVIERHWVESLTCLSRDQWV